jgi:hypothetical protein
MSARAYPAAAGGNIASTWLQSAATYAAIVFAAGFVLGTARVLWLVPRVGIRAAELAELPLMLVVIFLAARWINHRFLAHCDQPSRLVVGLTALALLFLAELVLGIVFLRVRPVDVLLGRDPISAAGYYLCLGAYAVMPWWLGRASERRDR